MKILVYPHDLGIGGSQLTAIEIAHEISRMGHEVIVYGQPGALSPTIAELGLEMIQSPPVGRRPTRSVVRDIARIIDERGIDIVHGYEWPPGLEAHLACRRHPRARAVTTVMSMAVAPFLPHSMPLVVGTEQIAAKERGTGRPFVSVLEPPVDIAANRPGVSGDPQTARRRWGLLDDRPTIVCVTRFARQLKLEGLLTAIDAVEHLHPGHPVQLLIVGDGDARDEVAQRAAQVNRAVGYPAVVLTGELRDPRAAYDVADVCIGMGGSALRSMAFAKPLVVQGEAGFFRLLTPDSLPEFLWTGWYGHGHGIPEPAAALATVLRDLLDDPARRAELGTFARRTVERRFSLAAAADHQLAIYRSALQTGTTGRRVTDEAAALARFGRYHLRKRAARALGRRSTDDFNANPVARLGPPPPGTADGAIVYFAGVCWDAVAGTDRHLVTALSRHQRVIWVDPPTPWTARWRGAAPTPALGEVDRNILRVHTSCPPGVSRPVLRGFAQWLTRRRAAVAARRLRVPVSTIVLSAPEQRMPTWRADVVKVYYETDDFVAGAPLFGASSRHLRRCRSLNVARSDVVLGITDALSDQLAEPGKLSATLANGTDAEHFAGTHRASPASEVRRDRPVVGVVGQFNDRLDLQMLEAVAELDLNLLLLGPRHGPSTPVRHRVDALIERSNVQWIDRQPFERLPSYLAAMDVGLTPYASTAFNRSSFPLKTLEYLAAGLPVVSTDLPSARSLGTDLVELAATPAEFAKRTAYLLERPTDQEAVARRRKFAQSHSWDARAAQLRSVLAQARARDS